MVVFYRGNKQWAGIYSKQRRFNQKIKFSRTALLIVPLIIELNIFSLGIALLLSVFNVKYRDTSYIWEIFLQAAFYAAPIIYPIQMD